jgi:hypothetical protein
VFTRSKSLFFTSISSCILDSGSAP